MKICVITMQGVYNYGSALQTYATQQYIKKLKHDVEVIDYYPQRMHNYGSLKQLYTEAMPFHKKPVKCVGIALLKYPSTKQLRKVFESFADGFLSKTITYNSNEELRINPPEADIYCTGSDQVWNNYLDGEFDMAYFLDFAPADKRRVSFASSFGRDDLTEVKTSGISGLLEKYYAISVREESGLQTIKDISVSLKECVLDPTLMISRSEWMEFTLPISERGYILVYKLHEDSIASDVAISIAEKTGKKIIRISTDHLKRIRGGKTIVAPKVEEFISYIANADLVITDSFHGTAFSILLNVPFIALKWQLFNDRIGTILRKTNLVSRHICKVNEAIEVYRNPIDFDEVNHLIDIERVKTERFIYEAFQSDI
ncbi:MAG: polysaccharide pyruvyl transferase family protein [Suipraeoptans sp.]